MARRNKDTMVPALMKAARISVKVVSRWAEFQDHAWGRLLMAVVENAILDLANPEERRCAMEWFNACDDNNIVVALGLNGEAMRKVLRQAGLLPALMGSDAPRRLVLSTIHAPNISGPQTRQFPTRVCGGERNHGHARSTTVATPALGHRITRPIAQGA